MTIRIRNNIPKIQKEVEIKSFTTEEKINLKNLLSEKIGYSPEFFYFGESGDGRSIYGGYKISSVVGGNVISMIGEPEDIKKAHKNLETKFGVKLIKFIKSKHIK